MQLDQMSNCTWTIKVRTTKQDSKKTEVLLSNTNQFAALEPSTPLINNVVPIIANAETAWRAMTDLTETLTQWLNVMIPTLYPGNTLFMWYNWTSQLNEHEHK